MGTCIICGKSVDGLTCSSHAEDVIFEFHGSRAEQLVSGRYYRGSVDGFADFGVFVNIGDRVTGLLHKSELPGRLESLDWDPGDSVYVQVTDVHDNGNIDLGWSIRQSDREFRGEAVHDPGADGPTEYLADEGESDDAETAVDERGEAAPDEESTTDGGADSDERTDSPASEETADGGTAADEAGATGPDADRPERVSVESLADRVGERVRIEAEVIDVYQTGGPTIFELADETGTVDCAAFKTAGERAYPEVEVGGVVDLVGEVEQRHGDLQVETESLDRLGGDSERAVVERREAALDERARPPRATLLADDPAVEAREDDLLAAATAIRRAVIDSRPVVVRHPATVDGYVAGAAIERALLPLVRDAHAGGDAEYHYVERRPLEEPRYGMSEATDDVTSMLSAEARHDERYPLFVLVGAGSTRDSLDGLELLETYDAPRIVVDGGAADEAVLDVTDACLSVDDRDVTTSALAASVAATVNEDVRDDLSHLPAISYWDEVPDRYAALAEEGGYDLDTVAELREAIALEAFYQTYEDKRELVEDLFWEEDNRALASYVSSQFRTKLDAELETASPHVERRDTEDVTVVLLDVAAFTHRFDFPPASILLDALHRREREDVDPVLTVGVDEDELRVQATESLDIEAISDAVADRLPEAGVRPHGARDGRIEFLSGERTAVTDAVVEEAAAAVDDGAAAGHAATPDGER